MRSWFGQRDLDFGLCCPNACLVRTPSPAIWPLLSECLPDSGTITCDLAFAVRMPA
ncbi:hypothetical protein H0178_11265 [Cytobacillus firmus]|nr:hypothetical protein [Cytobacillus firmus]